MHNQLLVKKKDFLCIKTLIYSIFKAKAILHILFCSVKTIKN